MCTCTVTGLEVQARLHWKAQPFKAASGFLQYFLTLGQWDTGTPGLVTTLISIILFYCNEIEANLECVTNINLVVWCECPVSVLVRGPSGSD